MVMAADEQRLAPRAAADELRALPPLRMPDDVAARITSGLEALAPLTRAEDWGPDADDEVAALVGAEYRGPRRRSTA